MVKNVGQITSDQNKVPGLQIFNVIADHSVSSTFSYQSEFDLGMEMPRRSIVVPLNLFTENSLLCTPRDLFANRTPAHITKVSELSITQ
jgi:hypothetical protein